jgi:capsular polysaccharide biosynthesis protein
MFDLLPRIHLLSHGNATPNSIDHFVVNKIRFPFQEDTLARTGIPKSRIIECTKDTHLEARTLLAPSINQTVPARWSCDYIRGLFLPAERPRAGGRRSRIYVSRSDARMRRVSNEDELIAFLGARGFETVTLTGLTVADQAAMFDDAEVIIAPHGSGLTNLLFCRPGTKVIELFSSTYVNPCYWVLSNTVGLDYYCHIGTGERPPAPPEGVDKRKWFFEYLGLDKKHGTDIVVDIVALSGLMRRVLFNDN